MCFQQRLKLVILKPTKFSTKRPYSDLKSRNVFSNPGAAGFVGAASSLASLPSFGGLPEVSRANSGKSSLLNSVLGRTNLVNTSKKAGQTRTLNFFRVDEAPGRLIVVDAPGYGTRGRPEWGNLFSSYLSNRTELKRVFILFNAKHGLNAVDIAMLRSLNQQCLAHGTTKFTLQSVITKADAISPEEVRSIIPKMRKEIFATAPVCLPPIITSSLMKPPFGIKEIRNSISEACGLGPVDS